MEHKTLFEIPVSEIAPNPHNPRLFWDDADLDELKGAMEKVGILVPLTVYKNSKPYPTEAEKVSADYADHAEG